MEFNLNNLMLDDNAIEILPDGDYHFTVESHEVGYASSDKLPPNTQQITVHLSVPFEKDGEIHFAKVTNRFNVWQKALFALRNFAQCIGMMPERGRHAFDMDKLEERARFLNPHISIFPLSAKTGEGMKEWEEWLLEKVKEWKE